MNVSSVTRAKTPTCVGTLPAEHRAGGGTGELGASCPLLMELEPLGCLQQEQQSHPCAALSTGDAVSVSAHPGLLPAVPCSPKAAAETQTLRLRRDAGGQGRAGRSLQLPASVAALRIILWALPSPGCRCSAKGLFSSSGAMLCGEFCSWRRGKGSPGGCRSDPKLLLPFLARSKMLPL